jgi:hypothetical protein
MDRAVSGTIECLSKLDEDWVRRVLGIKRRLGLVTKRLVDLDSVMATVGRHDFETIAEDITERSVVLARDDGTVDSLRAGPRRLTLVSYGEGTGSSVGGTLASELRVEGHEVTVVRLTAESGPAAYDSARAALAKNPVAVFAVSVRAVAGRGSIGLPAELTALIDSTAAVRPTLLASFGSP